MGNERLTAKQERFVEEYLKDLNAKAAYVRAGYVARGASAEVNASRLLGNAKVAKAIQEAKATRSERAHADQDRVLLELERIWRAVITDYAEWDDTGVRWKASAGLSDDQAAAIMEVSETISENGRTRKFKLHNKLRALELYGKHLGIFDKDASGPKAPDRRTPAERIRAYEEWRRSQGRPPLEVLEGGEEPFPAVE